MTILFVDKEWIRLFQSVIHSQSVAPGPSSNPCTQELVRSANPQAHPRPTESETLGVELAICVPTIRPGNFDVC